MEGLETRENTLVVVVLGKRGVALPVGTRIPANARVADLIPFDELLPHSAVFVTNGGCAASQHGIRNGKPLVCAGAGEAKPETSAKTEWCGIGVNLRTGTPTPEAIRGAVDKIVSNPKYKMRAKNLEAEMAMFDPTSFSSQTLKSSLRGSISLDICMGKKEIENQKRDFIEQRE
jgi:UDP:flavonoid glycosyltransferase YjiC (YdhE family)